MWTVIEEMFMFDTRIYIVDYFQIFDTMDCLQQVRASFSHGSRNGITTETLGQIMDDFLHFSSRCSRRNDRDKCSIV